MAKKIIYTNIEKVERNQRMVDYIDGKIDGNFHSFRDAAKRFKLNSSGTVYKIYNRVRGKRSISHKVLSNQKKIIK